MATISERLYYGLPHQPDDVVNAFKLDEIVESPYYVEYLKGINAKIKPTKLDELSDRVFGLSRGKLYSAPHRREPCTKLTSKRRRNAQLHGFSTEALKYTDFVKLHQLWDGYMKDILKLNCKIGEQLDERQAEIEAVLLRCDLHGSLMTVSQSKCPTLVGIKGIVIMETKETFKLITKANKVKIVAKKNTIFSIRLDNYQIRIFGSNFNYRPTDRINRKFKATNTVDL